MPGGGVELQPTKSATSTRAPDQPQPNRVRLIEGPPSQRALRVSFFPGVMGAVQGHTTGLSQLRGVAPDGAAPAHVVTAGGQNPPSEPEASATVDAHSNRR